jgi:transposase
MDAPPAPPVVSPEVLASLAPAVLALIEWQARQIRVLSARVAELEAKLEALSTKNPSNSSKPPSSTHPHAKPLSAKPKSKRSRGGQPGHAKHERALLPTEQCQKVVRCLPSHCRRCGQALHGIDPEPLRHQVWELPDIQPTVSEYQRHRLVCACGCSTCGELPAGVPTGQAGPRLTAFAGLLMACFRQSKRRAAQFLSIILNQPASAGWMVLLQNRAAEAVAATFTFFACRTSRAAAVLQELLGDTFTGIIHCDRARMYWCFGRLQWCWAHLKRDSKH